MYGSFRIPNLMQRLLLLNLAVVAVALLFGCGGGSGGSSPDRAPALLPTPTPTPTPVPGGDYFSSRFPHWTTFPLRVQFDSSVTPAVQSNLQQGMDAWKNATGGALSYVVVTSGQADVLVGFGNVSSTLHGLCAGTWYSDGTIVSMNITLSNVAQTASAATQTQVMAHEWGHALGLIDTIPPYGHSPDPADRMYAVLNPADSGTAPILTARDIATIQRLYGL
jgi:hypothetical protein